MKSEEYQKYRWFFTSTGKLVVGGKSAEQNEVLIKRMFEDNKNYVVMHTSTPGSPFSFIVADIEKVEVEDLEECAIFTGAFSREWRSAKSKAKVDIFKLEQVSKSKDMKDGTFAVHGKNESKKVKLELVLVKQKKKLRAVPEITAKRLGLDVLMKIKPGKIEKEDFAKYFSKKFEVKLDEVLNAIPSGGFVVR